MKAEIQIEVLEDGTVLWRTGKIPDQHHASADELQSELEAALGGQVKRTVKAGKSSHTHHHDHIHINEE